MSSLSDHQADEVQFICVFLSSRIFSRKSSGSDPFPYLGWSQHLRFLLVSRFMITVSTFVATVSRFTKSYIHTPRLYTSKFAFLAWLSINLLRGATSSPISILNTLSASTASSMPTCRIVRRAGSIVVSHRVSGFISPRPL